MSDTSERRSAALPRRSRWPGWIWAVPLAALGIVVWLGVRSFIARGPEIDVSFESSAGIRAGITEVQIPSFDASTLGINMTALCPGARYRRRRANGPHRNIKPDPWPTALS